MLRAAAFPLLVFANHVWAHPGHGAPTFHWHAWDLGHSIFLIIAVAVAALAIWKVK
jgi:hypothetical protein